MRTHTSTREWPGAKKRGDCTIRFSFIIVHFNALRFDWSACLYSICNIKLGVRWCGSLSVVRQQGGHSHVCCVKPLGGDHCSEDAEKRLQIVLLLPRSFVFIFEYEGCWQRRSTKGILPPQDEEQKVLQVTWSIIIKKKILFVDTSILRSA